MELIDDPLYISDIFEMKINFLTGLNLSCLFFVPIKNCFNSETTFDISQDLNSTFQFQLFFVILIGPNFNHVMVHAVFQRGTLKPDCRVFH